jgi:HTH-type transcriptional regulator/antitoxin HigA
LLVEKYEQENFPIDLPDPVAAIKFRMDQQGLTRKDLEPYIGSQSKVSEVLNRKRPLSLSMIRALHAGLDIPAEVLLGEPGKQLEERLYDPRDYPFTEMYHCGYFASFNGTLQEAKAYAEELLERLFAAFEGQKLERLYCRSSNRKLDENALIAWQARALELAKEQELPPYAPEKITPEYIREVIKLSYFSSGPLLARESLQKKGIPLVILAHLPHTYLDGASFRAPSGRAVIGVSLRHDRLDNFWFTLAHELAHVHLHLETDGFAFFDDIEEGEVESCSPQEKEADALARRLLIPEQRWENDKDVLLRSDRETSIQEFAERVGVSPAIVAGRIRWETRDYTRFSNLVGNKQVRKFFPTFC